MLLAQRLARHAARRDLGERLAGGLGDVRNGTRCARVHLEHVHRVALDGVLHVHQADDFERTGEHRGLALELALDMARERMRRQAAGRVARMHPRLLDVLHDAADQHIGAVANAVHVDLDGVREIAVQQHGRIVRHLDRFAHVAFEIRLLMHDLHGAAAQHVARPHHHRIADLLGELHRLGRRARGAVGRLAQLELFEQLLEALAVFGDVDRIGAGADDRHARGGQAAREIERCLAAVLHDHAPGLLQVDDLEHVFHGERLEVQPVGGVVVGRDRLRVAVHHDGLKTIFAQRERGVHAAVVELDALADAVRAAAEHHDFLFRGRLRLALVLVGRIHVRRLGGELGSAGVHPLVHRPDAELVALGAHRFLIGIEQVAQAPVGESLALEGTQRSGVDVVEAPIVELHLELDDLLDLVEEPRIDVREPVHLFEREAVFEGVAHVPDALRSGLAELALERLAIARALVEAVDADLEAAQRLLERLLEGAADGHHLAHRFHLRRQAVVGLGKFLKCEPGHLGDHVIDRRLEGRRRRAAGHLVGDLVQRVAHRELGRDFGDGKPRRLRRQSR